MKIEIHTKTTKTNLKKVLNKVKAKANKQANNLLSFLGVVIIK